jgi:hypothetical protein
MRIPSGANRRRIAILAIPLTAIMALTLSAGAQGATLSQRVYKVFTTEYRAENGYSTTQLQANITAAQTKLAGTAGTIDALSDSNSTAATALIDELENQYDAAGALGIFKPALTAFTALVKLPLTRTEHKSAVADETYVKRVLAINTAADLRSWQAKNFGTGGEPSNTTAFGGIIGISVPSIDLPISGTNSALKAFEKLQTEASKKVTTVLNTVGSDWTSWVAGFGIESG